MATPEYPSTLPGVSSMEMETTTQVYTNEEQGPGKVVYRRFTRVPSAKATVIFNFIETDFSIFQDFYNDDLKRGHKWFRLILPSAGGYLPHIVRCISHRTAPSPSYGYRVVTMELEIRGRRIYEDDNEGFPGTPIKGWNQTTAYGAFQYENNGFTAERIY